MSNSKKRGRVSSEKHRQTLLSFTPWSAAQDSLGPQREEQQLSQPDSAHDLSRTRQAPSLPEETWTQILDPLDTLALKTFRLVCRDWAALSAPRLYSTLYLNCYERCWSGLIAISKSCYVRHVTKVVWNPLVLMEECLDGATWKSRYANLLHGLNHRQTLDFYEAFVQVWKERNNFLLSSSIESISQALPSLYNCREIILSDDYDFEETCRDQFLRTKIQRDVDLLRRPLVWSLRPRMWKQTPENRDSLQSCREVFRAFQSCPSIVTITMDFWVAHSLLITELLPPFWAVRTEFDATYPGVTCLKLALRIFPLVWLDSEPPSTERALSDLLACTMCFPQLQELTLKPSFVDPGEEYIQFCWQQQRSHLSDDGNENYVADQFNRADLFDTSARPEHSTYLLTSAQADHYRRTEAFYETMSTEFRPNFVQLPRLRILRLYDLMIDSRLLLCWLSSQKQIPMLLFTLELFGKITFFGFEEMFVRTALASLNVQLLCGKNGSICSFGQFEERLDTPQLALGATKGLREAQEQIWIHGDWESRTVGDEVISDLRNNSMPEIFRSRASDIISRPDDFEDLIAKHEKLDHENSHYTYQTRLCDGRMLWEWKEGHSRSAVFGFGVGQSLVVPLLRVHIYRYPPSYYDEGYGNISSVHGSPQEQGPIDDCQEEEEQLLLQTYETELLGLDLIGGETQDA